MTNASSARGTKRLPHWCVLQFILPARNIPSMLP